MRKTPYKCFRCDHEWTSYGTEVVQCVSCGSDEIDYMQEYNYPDGEPIIELTEIFHD